MSFVRICRMLKMQRSFRALKAVRFLTGFRLMINCVLGSMVPLAWSTLLLTAFMMVFSLVFMQGTTQYLIVTEDVPDDVKRMLLIRFGSVKASMVSLLQSVTGGVDWGSIYTSLLMVGPVYASIFVFFVVFFLMSFFNITTSLFVDQALKLSRPDHEVRMLEKWREDVMVANDLKVTIAKLDTNENGLVTREEWLRMADTPEVRAYFEIADLEIRDANEFFDTVVSLTGSNEIDIDSFVEGCMKVKGGATSVDLQVLLFQVRDLRFMVEELSMTAQHQQPAQPAASANSELYDSTAELVQALADAVAIHQ